MRPKHTSTKSFTFSNSMIPKTARLVSNLPASNRTLPINALITKRDAGVPRSWNHDRKFYSRLRLYSAVYATRGTLMYGGKQRQTGDGFHLERRRQYAANCSLPSVLHLLTSIFSLIEKRSIEIHLITA